MSFLMMMMVMVVVGRTRPVIASPPVTSIIFSRIFTLYVIITVAVSVVVIDLVRRSMMARGFQVRTSSPPMSFFLLWLYILFS